MRLVSSTETPRRRQDASDIFSLLKFQKKNCLYIFFQFQSNLLAIPV